MKRTIILLILLFALVLQPVALAVHDFEQMAAGVYAYMQADMTAQAWIDGPLAEGAGSSTDNFIIDICHRDHEYNLDVYIDAAAAAVQPGAINNPVSRQRCALTLLSCGAGDRVPEELADETIGALGVMSYAYGLHLLNNGAKSELWTAESLAGALIDLQLPDGGWAVMGSFGDIDVTAMCLQALGSCAASPERDAAIERALGFLSACQLDNGRFSGMSAENCESCAQVVLALACVGVDPGSDERFIKNGVSALDAFLEFRLPSGGFAHLPGEAENGSATVQALAALTALSRIGTPYFNFSVERLPALKAAASASSALPAWKLVVLSIIALGYVIFCTIALIRKRGKLKQIIAFTVLAIAAAAAVMFLNIQSADSYYSSTDTSSDTPIGSAYLTIRCITVADDTGDTGIPEDGIILQRTELPIFEGDSAFDLLIRGVRTNKIQMEHEGGSGDMAYVNGIHYLYENQHGDLSGWMYAINGANPSVGSGSYRLQDGDEVIWEYTTNLGEDLK